MHLLDYVRPLGRILCLFTFGVAAAACALGVSVEADYQKQPPFFPDSASGGFASWLGSARASQRARPVVAVLAANTGTETTDFLIPHSVLKRSGAADVQAVAVERGAVQLMPALRVEIPQSLVDFDALHPDGADYVIVPALHDANAPAVLSWIRNQSIKGAVVIGVCSGALVLAQAGLLDGRQFTGHWYDRDELSKIPGAAYVPNRRYLRDKNIATSTGVTASVPISLALVEAIGGRETALRVAREIGATNWSVQHESSRFGLNFSRFVAYSSNLMALPFKHDFIIGVPSGSDDMQLAFVADAWARSGRVRVTSSASGDSVRLASGLRLLPEIRGNSIGSRIMNPSSKPMNALDETLCDIRRKHGARVLDWVALEMEYPMRSSEAACQRGNQ